MSNEKEDRFERIDKAIDQLRTEFDEVTVPESTNPENVPKPTTSFTAVLTEGCVFTDDTFEDSRATS